MGAMNRGLNLPQIQRIMNEFERESATMDMKEEMMSEAVDDVMEDDVEDEAEEGDKILKQKLDEIGVDLSQQVGAPPLCAPHVLCLSYSLRAAVRCAKWHRCLVSTHGAKAGRCAGRSSRRCPLLGWRWQGRHCGAGRLGRGCPASTA